MKGIQRVCSAFYIASIIVIWVPVIANELWLGYTDGESVRMFWGAIVVSGAFWFVSVLLQIVQLRKGIYFKHGTGTPINIEMPVKNRYGFRNSMCLQGEGPGGNPGECSGRVQ